MTECNCDLPETIREPYALTCKVIKDGDVIVDVGCSNDFYLLEMKKHLETHDINITVIGIEACSPSKMYDGFSKHGVEVLGGLEYLQDRDRKIRNALDGFINKPVAQVDDIDGTADIVTCFGFSPRADTRIESFKRMCMFLKPDGKAIYDMQSTSRTQDNISHILYKFTRCGCFFRSTKMERKTMTKHEAIIHAEKCVSSDDYGFRYEGVDCEHGTVIRSS